MLNNYKYAIVFAGQGAQKPGMGKSLYEASSAARAVFTEAGDQIMHDCFEADAERLKQTEVTQPAVYTMDMAAYAALRESLGFGGVGAGCFPEPSGVAGFSLGEYAAFTAAGVIDSIKTGLSLVSARSLFMKAAGANPDGSQRGAMAAGVGEKDAVLALIEKTRGEDILEAVNFNSPGQTVVAGDVAAVERFTMLAGSDRSLGVKAIPLSVSGAFHSPIMKPAAEELAKAMKNYTFCAPSLPVYLNSTGELYDDFGKNGSILTDIASIAGMEKLTGAADAPDITDALDMENPDIKTKTIMVRQIQSPVQWQKTIEMMAADGIGTIVEVGPGKTLTGLVRKIAPGITALHVEDAESLAETVRRVNQCSME